MVMDAIYKLLRSHGRLRLVLRLFTVAAVVLSPQVRAQSPKFSTLYSFSSGISLPLYPNGVVVGKRGDLYGPTQYGGTPATSCAYPQTCGMIFQLTPPGPSDRSW